MTATTGRVAVIASAGALSELPILERELARRGADFTVAVADVPEDATRLAREALAAGQRFLVSAGDDANLHYLVNGVVGDETAAPADVDIGVVAANSGCDVARTFGLPQDTSGASQHLFTGNYYELDLVRLAYVDRLGEERSRVFASVAQVGLGAAVTTRTKGLPKSLGRGRRFLGFWSAIPTFRPQEITVTAGRKSYEGTAFNVVVGNCQFAGGGMRLSPRSYPGDGVLDVLVMKGPKSDAFTMLPRIWRGEHVPSERIAEMNGKEVRIESAKPMPVEADGEPLGVTPASFEVIPQAIRLRV
ncbi:MAG: diacylglycerol kinase family protein [Actinomycetota bacterium]